MLARSENNGKEKARARPAARGVLAVAAKSRPTFHFKDRRRTL
jgi:hypothetical protein